MSVDLASLPYPEDMPSELRKALRGAKQCVSEQALNQAVDRLSVAITVQWQDQNPFCIAVLPTGLVLTGMLMQRLIFPLQLSSLRVLEDFSPIQALQHRSVVFIHGHYDVEVDGELKRWAQAAGATDVASVALLAQPGESSECAFAALELDVEGVFGAGLDLSGYGANLPGLYIPPPLKEK